MTPRPARSRHSLLFRLLGTLLAAVLVLAACGDDDGDSAGTDDGASTTTQAADGETDGESDGEDEGSTELVPLTLGTVESITNLPVVVGLAKGYFEEEGIDLTVEYMSSGVNIVPALASGQIDIGEGSITPGVFNSFGRDINTPVVAYKAGCAAGLDFCPLVIRAELDGEFEDWTDIRGKTVAISARWTASHQKLVLLDEAFGVSADEYNLIELPFSDMTQALGTGAIDAAIIIEPIATRVEQEGIGVRMLDDEMEPEVPVTLTSYSEELAADDGPDSVGVAYQRAYIRAVRDILDAREALDNGDSSLWDELCELAGVSEAYPVLADPETRTLVQVPYIPAEPYVTEEVFNTARDFYISGDQLTSDGLEVTYEQLVNRRFVEQALEQLG